MSHSRRKSGTPPATSCKLLGSVFQHVFQTVFQPYFNLVLEHWFQHVFLLSLRDAMREPRYRIFSMDTNDQDFLETDPRELTAEPMFPVHIEGVEPLTMFSLEHWLVLYTNGLAPQPPYLLAPFPAQIHSQDELMENLAEWELLRGTEVDADLDYILRALTSEHTNIIAGKLMLPQRAHERVVVYEGVLSESGRPEETTTVEQPTYPFIIVKTYDGRIISALSMDKGLTVNVTPVGGRTYAEAFADELASMFDPEGEWEPASVRTIHVPTAAASDPEVVNLGSEDHDTARRARQHLVDTHVVHGDTVDALASINAMDKLAVVSFTPIIRLQDDTIYANPDGSGTLVLASRDGGVPRAFVTAPEVDGNGRETYLYAPYSPATLLRGVEESYKTTAHLLRTRGLDDETNPFHVLRMGVESAINAGLTGTPSGQPQAREGS